MIEYVPYDQIDRKKYDECIEHSIQCRIYAFSWYLDSVTEQWDLLIKGDYDTVMPLPRRTKYGITYVYVPAWVQQLGIYSLQKLSHSVELEFFEHFTKRFLWIDYNMNADNQLGINTMIKKRNYLLPLGEKFLDIQAGYNKNRKRIAKKKFGDYSIDKKGDLEEFLMKFKEGQKNYPVSDHSLNSLRNLYHKSKNHVHIWNVKKGISLVAGLFWLEDARRITYLVPFANKEGKKEQIPSFLVNELIKSFEGQNKILDFEGSMIPGVEKFYQSFGAKAEHYDHFKKRFINNG